VITILPSNVITNVMKGIGTQKLHHDLSSWIEPVVESQLILITKYLPVLPNNRYFNIQTKKIVDVNQDNLHAANIIYNNMPTHLHTLMLSNDVSLTPDNLIPTTHVKYICYHYNKYNSLPECKIIFPPSNHPAIEWVDVDAFVEFLNATKD
jgi:hypothetical protein